MTTTLPMALSVTGTTKHYNSGFTLDDITFDLPAGYIMGLIGPNGAGKSTLIKLILNMIRRDAGRIQVLGLDAVGYEEAVKEQLGVVFDTSYFVDTWSVNKVERVMRGMYRTWHADLFDGYLRRFGLDRGKKVKELSRGMQMKLMLAVALSHDARLLILDEPTSGLDVLARDELMDILAAYIEDGERSVLFSTHITADLERAADFISPVPRTSSRTRSASSRPASTCSTGCPPRRASACTGTPPDSTRWCAPKTCRSGPRTRSSSNPRRSMTSSA